MTQADDAPAALPLQLTTANMHDMELQDLGGGAYEIRTTGTDPYVFTQPFAQPVDPKRQCVVAFEYFSTTGTDHMQIYLVPPLSEEMSVKHEGLLHSEGWSSYAMDLKPVLDKLTQPLQRVRLDFGGLPGKVIQIRGLQLRPFNAHELQLAARREAQREAEKRLEVHLHDYLHHSYPCEVTQVAVDDKHVHITGKIAGAQDRLFLAEAPLYTNITELHQFPFVEPLHADRNGHFSLTLDRQRDEGDHAFDRLLSRWAVVQKTQGGYQLLSHARYTDTVQPRADLPEEKPRNKKGLGGFGLDRPLSDLDDLNISAVTVNIVLNGLFTTAPGPGHSPFLYGGRTWYADDRSVEHLDQTLLEAAKRHIVVSAIILIGQPKDASQGSYARLIAHPDTDPSGIFAMPDVSSEAGLIAYAAGLDFLAQRYSCSDNQYGRIHHWIMHNEVNAGWIWTNAGDKTALLYMDLYHKSMRVAQLIARQYDPHSRAFISLEHHWNIRPPKIYAGRELLDLLLDFSAAEGDFDWAIAFHPYPQDLFDPRVWADNEVNFTFDTPKITFKNLEVLDAWVRQPRTFYLGQRHRIVHLTEQGLNSRDYTEKSLQDQAAGMAYAWNKYKHLDTIEVFDYHNWVDNRGEGGLRIGLRRFPDDPDDPLGKKPIWTVYRDLGTEKEADTNAFALSIIGIQSWAEVHYTGEIR